jgi:hypothetical protein
MQRVPRFAASAEAIIIVGVRVREHDVHVWHPIASSPAAVTYCSGSSAGARIQSVGKPRAIT